MMAWSTVCDDYFRVADHPSRNCWIRHTAKEKSGLRQVYAEL
jgi:hypothetical protein